MESNVLACQWNAQQRYKLNYYYFSPTDDQLLLQDEAIDNYAKYNSEMGTKLILKYEIK